MYKQAVKQPFNAGQLLTGQLARTMLRCAMESTAWGVYSDALKNVFTSIATFNTIATP